MNINKVKQKYMKRVFNNALYLAIHCLDSGFKYNTQQSDDPLPSKQLASITF